MYLNQKILDLGGVFDKDLSDDAKFLKCWKLLMSQHKDEKESGEVINEILSIVSNCNSHNCISTAKKLTKFLNYKSDLIKTLAIHGLNIVMRKISHVINKEEDPTKIKELIENVKGILSELKKRNIQIVNPLDSPMVSIKDDLKQFGVSNEKKELKNIERKEIIPDNLPNKNPPKNVLEIYQQILQFSLGAKDINGSIGAIYGMMKFLNSDCKEIRNMAAKEICKLFKVAAKKLMNETNPKKVMQYAEILLTLANKIQVMNKSGAINLSADSMGDLNQAILMIKEKVKSLYENDSFSSNNAKDNPFKNIFQKVINNIYNWGEGKSDEFISS